jgi:hypothetical protein
MHAEGSSEARWLAIAKKHDSSGGGADDIVLKERWSSQPQCVVRCQAGRSATVQQLDVDGVDVLLRLDSDDRGVCDRSTLFTLSEETKASQTRGW